MKLLILLLILPLSASADWGFNSFGGNYSPNNSLEVQQEQLQAQQRQFQRQLEEQQYQQRMQQNQMQFNYGTINGRSFNCITIPMGGGFNSTNCN